MIHLTRHPSLAEEPLIDLIRLIRTPHVGTVTAFSLLSYYGTAAKALEAMPELSRKGGRKTPLVPCTAAVAKKEIEATHKAGASFIPYGHAEYPAALLPLYDPPVLLIAKGNPHLLTRPQTVGIVGSRNASLHGRQLARQIARGLGAASFTVISGLARGIDAEAHAGALATGTIGISAVGIDQIYPQENTALYEQMAEVGCILTEQPFGTTPNPRLFPTRNRIIAGMSRGVVVVEASLKSGSLITARMTNEYGREVFAVPGSPLDTRNAGSHKLIKDGAHLIENAQDVIVHLHELPQLLQEETKSFHAHTYHDENSLASLRQEVHQLLTHAPVAIDELARLCHCTGGELMPILLELELAGRLQRLAGQKVMLLSAAA